MKVEHVGDEISYRVDDLVDLYVESGKYGQPRYTSDLTSCVILGDPDFFALGIPDSCSRLSRHGKQLWHLMHVVDTPMSDTKLVGSWASKTQESCLFTPHIVLWVAGDSVHHQSKRLLQDVAGTLVSKLVNVSIIRVFKGIHQLL